METQVRTRICKAGNQIYFDSQIGNWVNPRLENNGQGLIETLAQKVPNLAEYELFSEKGTRKAYVSDDGRKLLIINAEGKARYFHHYKIRMTQNKDVIKAAYALQN